MMNSMPFSVSMCVYEKDSPVWFEEALESVINQTVKPDEIILVVDGPITIELENIVSEYENKNLIKVIRLPQNMGHGIARRTGLENCTHELVALMDSDDICAENRFEKQLNLFKECPELSIVGGNIEEFVGSLGCVAGRRIVPQKDEQIKLYLKKRCPFNQVTVMFKKTDVESVGGYLDWYCNEDYYLWVRMYLADFKFANIDDILVHVRVGKDMYKRRGGWRYFKSEYLLQKFMLQKRIIGISTFGMNVGKRLIVQVLLPDSIRGYVFKKFARS